MEGQGLYIISFFESVGAVSSVFEDRAREMFAEHGLASVDQDSYYPGERISDAFFDVVDEVGERTMRQGGVQMGKDIPWPDGVDTPKQGLATINAVHQEAARPTSDAPPDLEYPAGQYTYEEVDETTARVGITKRYPFPEVMAEGVFVGIVEGLGDAVANIEDADTPGEQKKVWTLSW